MIELTLFIVLTELLIILTCTSVWFSTSYFHQRRKQKKAVQLLQHTWLKQQNLYREVLRKRLVALFQAEGEELMQMVDTVLEREQKFVQQLVQQLAVNLASPDPQQVIQIVQLINRQGEVYSQLAGNRPALMKDKIYTLSSVRG